MGKKVIQETRRFNDNRGETTSMRTKEDAHDYRYFPEPDILQVNFTDEMLDEIKAKLPEMPHKRLARYTGEYGLSEVTLKFLLIRSVFQTSLTNRLKYITILRALLTLLL